MNDEASHRHKHSKKLAEAELGFEAQQSARFRQTGNATFWSQKYLRLKVSVVQEYVSDVGRSNGVEVYSSLMVVSQKSSSIHYNTTPGTSSFFLSISVFYTFLSYSLSLFSNKDSLRNASSRSHHSP
jgi:hypothetical protein